MLLRKSLLNFNLDWKKIYFLPRLITSESSLCVFQYKLLNNILNLNKMLCKFNKVTTSLCSFCNNAKETPLHLFSSCFLTQRLWRQLQNLLADRLNIPDIMQQSDIFGFLDIEPRTYIIINHLFLIYKFYVYKARENKMLNINIRKSYRKKIINTEKNISFNNINKYLKFTKKMASNAGRFILNYQKLKV